MRVTESFLVKKHPSIDQLWLTGTLRVDIYNRKSERRMGYTDTLFINCWLSRWSHEARLHLWIFSYENITSHNYTIALNVIISWKVGKDLIEIQQAGIIVLMLSFSSQLTQKNNINTNEIHIRCIKSIWFCPVKFNCTYLTNKNGIFSSHALDTFGKIWLIQVSSVATYRNKRHSRSDQVVLVLK